MIDKKELLNKAKEYKEKWDNTRISSVSSDSSKPLTMDGDISKDMITFMDQVIGFLEGEVAGESEILDDIEQVKIGDIFKFNDTQVIAYNTSKTRQGVFFVDINGELGSTHYSNLERINDTIKDIDYFDKWFIVLDKVYNENIPSFNRNYKQCLVAIKKIRSRING